VELLPWTVALERYTQQVPREVLRLQLQVEGELDCVVIFRGFSSSLMRATPTDLNQPVIPPAAKLIRLDRLQAPFNPDHPQVIAADLDAAATLALLRSVGLDPVGLG
jgi:hypothetical protein